MPFESDPLLLDIGWYQRHYFLVNHTTALVGCLKEMNCDGTSTSVFEKTSGVLQAVINVVHMAVVLFRRFSC